MKEAVRAAGRTAVDKERTKIRERQRRSITTNIFHGLRKHGGYRLSPRADINEVLRHLAREAGWTVEPDGTTYRSSTAVSDVTSNSCPLCGGGRKSTAPPTPSGSTCLGGGGGGGECSTTASPRRAAAGESAVSNHHHMSAGSLPLPFLSSSGGVMTTNDALMAIYMCGAVQQNARGSSDATSAAATTMYGRGQQVYVLQQNRTSNQNTPAGSP